jgi:6-phosphogluconolactonase
MAEPRLIRLPDPEALAQHVATWLTERALAKSGRFTLALSGGSTPRRLYQILAGDPFRSRFPWKRTHFFWGDERFVPHDDPASNYRMAYEAMFAHVDVPPENIHPMPGTGDIAAAARHYESELQVYYGSEALDASRPLFDVTLLGLGENGHTASLWPGTAALDETLAWVVPVTGGGVPQPRLTLTYPAIACSDVVAFLVAGAGKREALRRVLAGDRTLPATRVTAIGELIWFVDEAAAG